MRGAHPDLVDFARVGRDCRFGVSERRSFYPDDVDKANQDALAILRDFAGVDGTCDLTGREGIRIVRNLRAVRPAEAVELKQSEKEQERDKLKRQDPGRTKIDR